MIVDFPFFREKFKSFLSCKSHIAHHLRLALKGEVQLQFAFTFNLYSESSTVHKLGVQKLLLMVIS
jgi:hypothetical protein